MPAKLPTEIRYTALLHLLATADTVWNASRSFFARWELSPSQFNILNLLGGEPEGISQIELGRRLIMHRSNVTGLVDRMERRGLVKREDALFDRRAYRVVLTKAGRELLAEIYPHYHAAAEATWNGLPAATIKQVSDALTHVARNASQVAQTGDKTS